MLCENSEPFYWEIDYLKLIALQKNGGIFASEQLSVSSIEVVNSEESLVVVYGPVDGDQEGKG